MRGVALFRLSLYTLAMRLVLGLGFAACLFLPCLGHAGPRTSDSTGQPLALARSAVVRIESGWFTMGSDDAGLELAVAICALSLDVGGRCRPELFEDEAPQHRVYVQAFQMDRHEVSHADYRRCVSQSVCTPSRVSDRDVRLGHPRHPVGGVTFGQASRYCRWVGGRLPTEAQWERAARGGSLRPFPWGQAFNARLANHGRPGGLPNEIDGYRFAAPVDAFPDGASAHGLLNMAGNVWEMTQDHYSRKGYGAGTRVDPTGPDDGETRVLRGGSWRAPAHALRVTQRAQMAAGDHRPDVGFRCAYDAR